LTAKGDAALALRAELIDPALESLLAAARKYDEDACRTLRFAGLPGYLSVPQCLDVHSGDYWTPLLEAVACGNLDFAGALVRAGADPHRSDRHGLSPLFWARILHGRDAASKLFAQQLVPAQCLVDVQCKDGVLHVSKSASEWMDVHFPRMAAAAVPCATLALTLKAQGLEVTAAAEVSVEHSPSLAVLNAHETEAVARLWAAQQKDVRDAMILEMHVDKASLEHGFACVVSSDDHIHDLRALMQCFPEPALLRGELTGTDSSATFVSGRSSSLVDILQSLASNPTECLHGPRVRANHLARARLATIGVVASGSVPHLEGLSLGQLFVLYLLREDKLFLDCANCAFYGSQVRVMDQWGPFAASLLEALRALPVSDSSIIVYCSVRSSFKSDIYAQGNILTWSGFVIVTDDPSILASHGSASPHTCDGAPSDQDLLFCIKASSARILPKFFGDKNCGMLLPCTPFRVVGVSSSQQHAKTVQIDLEEISLVR